MTKIVPKEWGYETQIVNLPQLYCGKILSVLPNGKACSIHYHKLKHETFYVTAGQLTVEVYEPLEPEERDLAPTLVKPRLHSRRVVSSGQLLILPPFTPHRFWVAITSATFIEFSTPDDPSDSYRIVPSGPIPK